MAAPAVAIEAARISGHARLADLCDPDSPAHNLAYLAIAESVVARGRAQPPPQPSEPTPKASDLGQAAAAAKACPSRYRDSCGCAEPFRCVVLFGSRVTLEDCRRCLETETPTASPPGPVGVSP